MSTSRKRKIAALCVAILCLLEGAKMKRELGEKEKTASGQREGKRNEGLKVFVENSPQKLYADRCGLLPLIERLSTTFTARLLCIYKASRIPQMAC